MAATIGFASSTVRNLKIRLELTEPDKKDDSWSLTAIATVTSGTDIVSDAEVQFYHNGTPVDSPEHTDGEGRATKEFADLKKGSHTFEAKIAGTSISSRQTKVLKEDRPKRPASLKITKHGGQGYYTIFLQVLDENGGAAGKARVRVADSSRFQPEELETDDKGTATYSLSFMERERYLTFTVPGTSISHKQRFFGPWPTKKVERRV